MVVTRAGELAGHGGRLPTAGTTLEADLENQADRLDVRNRRNQKKKIYGFAGFLFIWGLILRQSREE